MSIKVLTASGYIIGAAGVDESGTIVGLTIFPGTADGGITVAQGINGGDQNVIPTILVKKDLTPYHIPIKPKILSTKRTFVTFTGTGIQVIFQIE